MRKYIILIVVASLLLAACSDAASDSNDGLASTPEVENIESAVTDEAESSDDTADNPTYEFDAEDFTVVYPFESNWGGVIEIRHPDDWRVVRTGTEYTVYLPDRYLVSLSANTNPANTRSVQDVLDSINQSAEIFEIQLEDGRTFYYTDGRMGNSILGGLVLADDTGYIIGQMTSSRGAELEPMLDGLLELLLTTEYLPDAELAPQT